MHWISHSEKETISLGYTIGLKLPINSIVCFFGDLGAGKTTFIKGVVAGAAGIQADEVISPTFVYLNVHNGLKRVFHFDLYRLGDADEFLSMGFEDYFFAGGICCLEWSEKIESILPESCIKIFMKHAGEDQRKISIVREKLNEVFND